MIVVDIEMAPYLDDIGPFAFSVIYQTYISSSFKHIPCPTPN